MPPNARLCHLSELPDGGSRGFDPRHTGQDTMLIVRQGERVFAWDDRCPHHGTPMAWRKNAYLNAAGDRIVCAAHGAQFTIDTGLCTLGPCRGDSLTAIGVQIQPNGDVHLTTTKEQQETTS